VWRKFALGLCKVKKASSGRYMDNKTGILFGENSGKFALRRRKRE